MMRRRTFLSAAGAALLAPTRARAQGRAPVVAYLSPNQTQQNVRLADLLDGLRELGYVPGVTFELGVRAAEGYNERLPGLARELVALQPRVFVAAGSVCARPAAEATNAIPILAVAFQDPDATELVGNFSRPQRNVTGIIGNTPSQAGKLVQLARELVPSARVVGLLDWTAFTERGAILASAREAAAGLGLELRTSELANSAEAAGAFTRLVGARVDCIVVPSESLFLDPVIRRGFVAAAGAARMPTIYGYADTVRDGGLISYSTAGREIYLRAAVLVDRLLKGAPVADVPVEFPTAFDLVVNVTTARQLGIAVPPGILAQATQVIE